MDWHACGTGFDTEKMALQLKMALNFHQEKVLTNTWDIFFTWELKKSIVANHFTEVGRLVRQKKGHFEGSVGKMAVTLSLLTRDETSWDVAALLTMLADDNGLT